MMGRAKFGRGIVASATAALCLGATAAAAQAATLSVSVKPKTSHSGGTYDVSVHGSVSHRQLKKKPFVLGWIQYSSQSCAGTAQKEYKRVKAPPFLEATITGTPFHTAKAFTASAPGTRHVCVYLYSHFIQPTSTAQPIARAGTKYFVVP
jgi:hypothetical protein